MEISEYKDLYASEAADILQALESGTMELEAGSGAPAIDELFRHAHNLKGMSGAMGYDSIVEASHSIENVLDRCRTGKLTILGKEADALLKVVDFLREMISGVIEDGESEKTRRLLGEIISIIKINFEGPIVKEVTGEDVKRLDNSQPKGIEPRVVDEVGRIDEKAEGLKEKDEKQRAEKAKVENNYYTKISSTRVEIERLDNLMDLVGELIISRIRLGNLAEKLVSKPVTEELIVSGRLISGIQKEIVEARLVPAGNIFQRFKRLVRDVSKELNKEAQLKIIGADIGLDRTILEAMIDPLVHLIRNALDHGIESPAERKAAGKDEFGTISLCCRRERNFVIIEVNDDGKGVDFAEIAKRNANTETKEGTVPELSNEELSYLLTSPGFSTKKTAGKYSGRGVGMNVAKKVVESLGGALSIESRVGKGTSVRMRLPITLSIIKALLFQVAGEVHALPIEYIKETTRIEKNSFKTIGGAKVFLTRQGTVPVVESWELLDPDNESLDSRYVKIIVLETERGMGGVIVNKIIGQQDVVIKGLPGIIKGMEGISGATVLGSGKVAFIWDPRYLLRERQDYEFDQQTVISEN
ncbi:chemotaxis protein CheA [bacterium]|nr:chemotaxis protein CheA [bacterium]